MSPWTDTDTDTGTARRATIQAHLDESRRMLADLRATLEIFDDIELDPDPAVASLRRVLAKVERPPLPRSWHLDEGLDRRVVDHTCGRWPSVCADRWHLDTPTTRLHYTCTRIANHTGRHAAGMHGVIVAVWEDDEPEVLGAVEGAA